MKITLELPSNLLREMKLQAAQQGRKLNDVAEQVFRRGLAMPPAKSKSIRRGFKLPLIKCRHAASAGEELTPARVANLLLEGDVERVR